MMENEDIQPTNIHLLEHLAQKCAPGDIFKAKTYEELLQIIWVLGKFEKNYHQIEPMVIKICG